MLENLQSLNFGSKVFITVIIVALSVYLIALLLQIGISAYKARIIHKSIACISVLLFAAASCIVMLGLLFEWELLDYICD